MAVAVTMPRLGLSMAEGTVTEWRVRLGDPVTRGQILLVVESEKAEVEVEAFADGILRAVYVEEGVTVPVGALLGAIADAGEEFDAAKFAASFVPEKRSVPKTASVKEQAPAAASASAAGPAEPTLKAAPAARAAARKLGVDLATVAGSGPGGRILPEDVERAASSRVTVNGGWVSAEVRGQGPPLLFVCGYGVDATSWRRQADGLSADHRVLTYDHRGIGGSSPVPESGITLAGLADDAHALLLRSFEEPALVVGASLGAAVALELAIAHPGEIRGLVLVTPLLTRDARLEAVLRSWDEAGSPASEGRIRAMLPWFFAREYLSQVGRREAAAAAFRAMAKRTPAPALRHHAATLFQWLDTRTQDLARVAVPALVVAGSEDLLSPLEQAETIARLLPAARLEVFEGAGHALALERAEQLNAFIQRFAAEICGNTRP